jgi:cytochrome c nitrite reductase small subunit
MQEQYDGWQKGSHHAVATCNDCHLPHDSIVRKLFTKAQNGYHHSRAFTLQNFAEPIFIKPKNAALLEQNCRRCHLALISELGVPPAPGAARAHGRDLIGCARCHVEVGHGPRR